MKKRKHILTFILVLFMIGGTALAEEGDASRYYDFLKGVDIEGFSFDTRDSGDYSYNSSGWYSDEEEEDSDPSESGWSTYKIFVLIDKLVGGNPYLLYVYILAFVGLLLYKLEQPAPVKSRKVKSVPEYKPRKHSEPLNPPPDTDILKSKKRRDRINASSIDALKQIDPAFSEAAIEALVKEWVAIIEKAKCSGDLDSCRSIIPEELYNTQLSRQKMLKKSRWVVQTKDLSITDFTVASWKIDGDKEYLDVWFTENKCTYTVSRDNPFTIISGDRNMIYSYERCWQLVREAGNYAVNTALEGQKCPNCGANVNVAGTGRCEYCGSVLFTQRPDWILNKTGLLAT